MEAAVRRDAHSAEVSSHFVAMGPSTEVPVSLFGLRPTDWRFARKLGLSANSVTCAAQLSLLGMIVTWLPLFVLSLIEGRAFGSNVTVAFLNDYVPHGRYLLALPLLLFLSPVLARRTEAAIRHFDAAGLVGAADQDRFRYIVMSTARASRSRIAAWSFVVLTCLLAAGSYFAIRELDVSNWMIVQSEAGARAGLAGTWSLLVSTPLVRLLHLHAFWKLGVWIWCLVQLARLDLQVNAFHADARCGLRFLGETQLAFIPLIAALGIQLGCMVALPVSYRGASLASYQMTMIAFVVLSVIVLAGPLCVFARRVWLERERAEDSFSVWSSLAARGMSRQVSVSRQERVPEQLAGSEISSMTDASALFDRILATRAVPMDIRQVALIVIAAVVSTLLPLLTLLPLADISRRLAAILL